MSDELTGSSLAWQQTGSPLLGERVRVTRNERGIFVTADGLVVEWLPPQLLRVAIPTVPNVHIIVCAQHMFLQ